MADYICAARTNYFRVTDLARLKELIKSTDVEIFEDLDYDKPIAGGGFEKATDRIALGGYESFAAVFDEEGEEIDVLGEIRKILAAGEVCVYFEAGWEKLRYVSGVVIVVTRDSIGSMNLEGWARKHIRRRLGPAALDNLKTTY